MGIKDFDFKGFFEDLLSRLVDWLSTCPEEHAWAFCIGCVIATFFLALFIVLKVPFVGENLSVTAARFAKLFGHVIEARLDNVTSEHIYHAAEKREDGGRSNSYSVTTYTGSYSYTVDGEEYTCEIPVKKDAPQTVTLYYLLTPKKTFMVNNGISCFGRMLLILLPMAVGVCVKAFIEILREG